MLCPTLRHSFYHTILSHLSRYQLLRTSRMQPHFRGCLFSTVTPQKLISLLTLFPYRSHIPLRHFRGCLILNLTPTPLVLIRCLPHIKSHQSTLRLPALHVTHTIHSSMSIRTSTILPSLSRCTIPVPISLRLSTHPSLAPTLLLGQLPLPTNLDAACKAFRNNARYPIT